MAWMDRPAAIRHTLAMTRKTEKIALPSPAPGTHREIIVHRWSNPGARPKVYLHAALHADELPGVLMLDHLAALLDEADAAGEIVGEVVMLPYANPIGFDQFIGDGHLGRYRFADGGGNFNRDWPGLAPKVAAAVEGQITDDPAQNVSIVRQALLAAVADLSEETEKQAHQKALLSHSIDADMVFDVHCDWLATLHLFASNDYRSELDELGRDLGSPVMLLDDELDARPFDGANSFHWAELRDLLGLDKKALPPSCFSTTIELRGEHDVTDEYASADAANLLRYMRRRGVLSGNAGELPPAVGQPTPLEGTWSLKAPVAGIVTWKAELGQHVNKGDLLAELVEVGSGSVPAPCHPIISGQAGILFSIHYRALHRPGERIGKVAGPEPVSMPGEQLLSNR